MINNNTYYMKKILIVFAAAMIAAACDLSTKSEVAEITLSLELDGSAYASADRKVTIQDINSSATFDAMTDASGKALFRLLPGVYDASVSFQITENGKTVLLNAFRSGIVVNTGDRKNVTLKLVKSEKSAIVIKELYNGGCMADDGVSRVDNDSYVILYNNTDTAVDVSNYNFAFCGLNSFGDEMDDFTEGGELTFEKDGGIPAFQGTWGFKNPVTIQPYSQIVIAIYSAINHTATYTNSVDLSNSSYYVMYDPESGWNMESKYLSPSENIPAQNYLKASKYKEEGIAWSMSLSSPAFFIFEKENAHEYVMNPDNHDRRNFCLAARIPFEWIVDGVEVFGTEYPEDNTKRFTAGIDAGKVMHTCKLGHTLYRNVDKEATEAIAENAGKLVYNYTGGTSDAGVPYGSTDPSGIDAEKSIVNGAKIIYKDTNNSSYDFHERMFASLTGK